MDDYLEVKLDDLRVREIEEIEEHLGVSLNEAFGKGASQGKAMRALGYIVKRRENPDFTWEDAGELIVKFSDEDTPPTDASD